jgi:hypothetical protein
MKNLIKSTLVILLGLFVIISCQESSVEAEIDQLDKDMVEANQLVDEYFASSGGRLANFDVSITVLRYEDGQLLYATANDGVSGYNVVEETTVTNIVEGGDFIFWFAGKGLTDLEGIVFDEASQNELDDFPFQVNFKSMWAIQLPSDISTEELKYDIIYQFVGNDGAPIRLDPKIQLGQTR